MSTFCIVEHVATTTDYSNITDLDVMMVDEQAYLFASTQYDGTLTNWAISQSSLTLVGTTAYRGGLQAAGTSSIMQVNVSDEMSVLTGGATASGALQTHEITAVGVFTGGNVLVAGLSKTRKFLIWEVF